MKQIPYKIISKTTDRPINNAGAIHVTGIMFMFKNNGNTSCFINNVMLYPGETWGIDNSHFLSTALANGSVIDIKEDTNFNIRFGDRIVDNTVTDEKGNTRVDATVIVQEVILVETIFEIKKIG